MSKRSNDPTDPDAEIARLSAEDQKRQTDAEAQRQANARAAEFERLRLLEQARREGTQNQ